MRPDRRILALLAVGLALGATAAVDVAAAQGRPAPDTFTATTAAMTPADVKLKIDVMTWSDEAAREAAVEALAADDPAALKELPTLGYVWLSGSAVGYAVKYAHKAASPGGERVTIVTDKPLGAYGLRPWSVAGDVAEHSLAYSVIELDLDASGSGAGTLSLAAKVVVDADAGRVSLDRSNAANVLAAARREPKPYWAQGG